MILGDHKERFTVGTRFNYLGFWEYANGVKKPAPDYLFSGDSERWEVERVVERGLVISHPNNKGHQHLIEWDKPIHKIKFA